MRGFFLCVPRDGAGVTGLVHEHRLGSRLDVSLQPGFPRLLGYPRVSAVGSLQANYHLRATRIGIGQKRFVRAFLKLDLNFIGG